MRLLLASGDTALAEGMTGAFADDRVAHRDDLATLGEPAAFAAVDAVVPTAVVVAPDWTRDTMNEVRGCWWFAGAAAAAGVPTVLVSTAEVFDAADRRPRDEFAVPDPSTAAGRRAFAAEQIVQRTTARAVIVRVGPTDVGACRLERLLGGTGVVGESRGAAAAVTPVAAEDLGRVVRALAVGRRPGIFHVAGDDVTLADAADRLGVPAPPGGYGSAPPPLATVLCAMLAIPAPAAWPAGDPQAVASAAIAP